MSQKIEVATALIIRLQDGDEAAFRAIYDQLHERVYRLLFSLVKDHEQTQELLQETFVSLWLHRAKLNASQSLYPYIYLTARRLAIDYFRKKITETDAKVYLKQRLVEEINDTEQTLAALDLQHFTEQVVKTLPKQQQTVFILSRKEGLSHDEIAERLQISRNTVKNHLVGALKTLKLHFAKHDITYLYFLFFIGF